MPKMNRTREQTIEDRTPRQCAVAGSLRPAMRQAQLSIPAAAAAALLLAAAWSSAAQPVAAAARTSFPRQQSSAQAVSRRFPITALGAVGDGKTLNTKAIQGAIEACARDGGGVVVVPQGTFVTGALFLKQGVNLQVERGAVLKGSQDTNDYPWINTRIGGLEMKWPAALVNADSVTNLQLTGEGTIDGSGERWWKEYWDARARENGLDPHFKVGRPRLIHIIRGQRLLVRGLSLKDSAFWNLQLTYCDQVEVRNLKIRAPHTPIKAASSDGIDIDSTRNVLIEACDIECDDDAICLKAGRGADGLRVNRPTENVTIRDCRVGHAAGLVAFGSETAGGIRNVTVTNCRADSGCLEVVRFKTHLGRGGIVENVLYENIAAEDTQQVFSFNMNALGGLWMPEAFRDPPAADNGTPVFRNIIVRHLTARNCKSAGRLVGLPESPLRGLTLENVDIQAQSGFTIRHTQGLRFNNVKLNGSLLAAPGSPEASDNDGAAPQQANKDPDRQL
jgi:polygalacturonase